MFSNDRIWEGQLNYRGRVLAYKGPFVNTDSTFQIEKETDSSVMLQIQPAAWSLQGFLIRSFYCKILQPCSSTALAVILQILFAWMLPNGQLSLKTEKPSINAPANLMSSNKKMSSFEKVLVACSMQGTRWFESINTQCEVLSGEYFYHPGHCL